MKLVRLLAISSLFLLLNSDVKASHISGGDVTVEHIEGNSFLVKLQLFRDCINANPGALLPEDLVMYAYLSETDELYDNNIFMPLDSIVFPELGDECYSPEICIEIGFYSAIVELEDEPEGYYFSWERCCRVGETTNLNDAGNQPMVFSATVPDPALQNSSPQFLPYPNDGYFCVATDNEFSFTAIDPDGDSLVYSLATPIAGSFANSFDPDPIGGGPKPFDDLQWAFGYDLDNILGGTPPMAIDPVTGVITAAPELQGFWAFGVVVEEFRDGVKIGEVRREITMESTICDFDIPPMFSGFDNTDTAYFQLFMENELFIVIEDNPSDSIEITQIESEIFDEGNLDITANYDTTTFQLGLLSGVLSWDSLDCGYVRDEPYWVYFIAESENACTGERSTDTLNLAIIVQLPPEVPTQFVAPAEEYTIIYGQEDSYVLDVIAQDGNFYDTLELSMTTPLDIGVNPISFQPDSGFLNVTSPFEWQVECDDISPEPYIITFQTLTYRCFQVDTLTYDVELTVTLPDDEPTIQTFPSFNVGVWEVFRDSTYCFNVAATDENNIDTLIVTVDRSSDVFSAANPATFADTSGVFEVSSQFCWQPDCSDVSGDSYRVDFTIYTVACDTTNVIEVPMDLFIVTTSDGDLDTIPNVITPNDDGYNDRWRIAHVDDFCVKDAQVRLFNRWGQFLLEDDLDIKWNGEIDGSPASPGVYYYIIDYEYLERPKSYSGNFSILR